MPFREHVHFCGSPACVMAPQRLHIPVGTRSAVFTAASVRGFETNTARPARAQHIDQYRRIPTRKLKCSAQFATVSNRLCVCVCVCPGMPYGSGEGSQFNCIPNSDGGGKTLSHSVPRTVPPISVRPVQNELRVAFLIISIRTFGRQKDGTVGRLGGS